MTIYVVTSFGRFIDVFATRAGAEACGAHAPNGEWIHPRDLAIEERTIDDAKAWASLSRKQLVGLKAACERSIDAIDRSVIAGTSAMRSAGSPIVAAWRANGRDVEPEIGRQYLIVIGGTWTPGLMFVGWLRQTGDILQVVGNGTSYSWDHVNWFVPVDEIAPASRQ